MKEEEIKKLSIYEKLSLITDEIGVVEKGLRVQVTKTSSYKAVSERDVLDAIKPIEKKYRVYSYPSKREVIDRDILTKETDYGKTNTLFMRIETTYRFVNLDNTDEFVETTVYGDGLDTGDKAPGKAMTYADKYALMKAYKLSTGDDPDKDASPEKGYSKQTTKKTITKQVEEKSSDLMMIQEKQKQRIVDTVDKAIIKKFLIESCKEKLSDLTWEQANQLLEFNEKIDKEVF